MQSVNAAFTAEAKDRTRLPKHALNVSWKKATNTANRTFTIGVSAIGGSDLIDLEASGFGSPSDYRYDDESDYATRLEWERQLSLPLGGISKAGGEFALDNNSQRFTPDYMGGSSALFTAVGLPRRPFVINAGFKVNGVDTMLPQFSGLTAKPPSIDISNRVLSTYGFDFLDFLSSKKVESTGVFTGVTTDYVMEQLFLDAGITTSQYDFEQGANTIPFVYFESGDSMGGIIDELVQAELGHFFQDEEGIYHFWNRYHWNVSPYNQIQHILMTSQVINQEINPQERLDSIINSVQVRGDYLQKYYDATGSYATVYYYDVSDLDNLSEVPLIHPSGNTEIWIEFDDPILELDPQINWFVNTMRDNEGDYIGSVGLPALPVQLAKVDLFSKTAKLTFSNSSGDSGYLTYLEMFGRLVDTISSISVTRTDSASMTAYEERSITVENRFIQNTQWAELIADYILQFNAQPLDIQKLTIRALPQLQMGDLISYGGRELRILGIRGSFQASSGFIQELLVSPSNFSANDFFTIGVSTIGGEDTLGSS